MAIKILSSDLKSTPVTAEFLISATEKNRDRIRSISSMILTACGILISASVAIIVFITDKRPEMRFIVYFLVGGAFCFASSATLSVASSFLRVSYVITTMEQFVNDILTIYHSELRILRISLVVFLSGLLLVAVAVIIGRLSV